MQCGYLVDYHDILVGVVSGNKVRKFAVWEASAALVMSSRSSSTAELET